MFKFISSNRNILPRCRAAVAFCVLLAGAANHANAQYTWLPTGTGSWVSPGNWSGGAVPTSSGTTVITNGGTAVLSAAQTGSYNELDLGGVGTGSILINGGELDGRNAYLGIANTGAATISSGTWSNSSQLIIGYFTDGSLQLNGGYVTDYSGVIGFQAQGSATVAGGTWSSTYGLFIGQEGSGTLRLQSGLVTTANSYIGYSNADGTAIVTGGTWNSSEGLYVGYGHSGTLTMSGGLVEADQINMFLSSIATVTGGTLASSGQINMNQGTVNLSDSGVLEIGGGSGTLSLGSSGTFNIGNGSTNGTFLAATVNGSGSSSVVNFSQTGTYDFTANLTGTMTLKQTGTGRTVLYGANTFSGSTIVTAGSLVIAGGSTLSSSVSVSEGSTLIASGSVAGSVIINGLLMGSGYVGAISGSGLIKTGDNSTPAILTASSVTPSSGQTYDFVATSTSTPVYSQNTSSGNSVLRLTAATPFSQALDSSNVINIYLQVSSLTSGETFKVGFYTDAGNFLTSYQYATYNYYVENLSGPYTYDGLNYSKYSAADFTVSDVLQNAAFSDGTEDGYQMIVQSAVPEPAGWMLLGAGAAALSLGRLRLYAAHRPSDRRA